MKHNLYIYICNLKAFKIFNVFSHWGKKKKKKSDLPYDRQRIHFLNFFLIAYKKIALALIDVDSLLFALLWETYWK